MSDEISEVKLGVAVSEMISAIHAFEHPRILQVTATYKIIHKDNSDVLVPDIKISLSEKGPGKAVE